MTDRGESRERDPFKPSLSLLVKLGSISVHVEEMLSTSGHAYDRAAIESLLSDEEVVEWLKKMCEFMPVKR